MNERSIRLTISDDEEGGLEMNDLQQQMAEACKQLGLGGYIPTSVETVSDGISSLNIRVIQRLPLPDLLAKLEKWLLEDDERAAIYGETIAVGSDLGTIPAPYVSCLIAAVLRMSEIDRAKAALATYKKLEEKK